VAQKINLPRTVLAEQRYLTIEQVELLANECGYPTTFSKHRSYAERDCETYRLVVLFLAYTGVRFGEMAALKVGRLNLPKRSASRACIRTSCVTPPPAWRSRPGPTSRWSSRCSATARPR